MKHPDATLPDVRELRRDIDALADALRCSEIATRRVLELMDPGDLMDLRAALLARFRASITE